MRSKRRRGRHIYIYIDGELLKNAFIPDSIPKNFCTDKQDFSALRDKSRRTTTCFARQAKRVKKKKDKLRHNEIGKDFGIGMV